MMTQIQKKMVGITKINTIQYNTSVDVPYVTSESESRDDDDGIGDEYAIEWSYLGHVISTSGEDMHDIESHSSNKQHIA